MCKIDKQNPFNFKEGSLEMKYLELYPRQPIYLYEQCSLLEELRTKHWDNFWKHSLFSSLPQVPLPNITKEEAYQLMETD